MDLTTTTQKTKSFWSRPEGKTGLFGLVGLGIGGYFVLMAALPLLIGFLGLAITAVGKTIVLAGLAAILFALLYILTNSRFQTLCKFLFQSGMRKITSIFIEIDPIGIMKGYISTLSDQLANIMERKSELNGQITSLKLLIESNGREITNSLATASVAKQKGNAQQMTINARNASRIEDSNTRLNTALSKMNMLYTMLTKYAESSELILADMKSDVSLRARERKSMKSASSAIASASAILRGGGPERELYDSALEFSIEDYGRRLGEIDDFMQSTKSIVDGIDLQNGVWEERALKQLEAVESKTNSLVIGNSHNMLVQQNSFLKPVEANADFSKFFK